MENRKHHRLRFWLSVVTAVLVVLGMIVLTVLPFAMELGAEHMLVKYGAKSATIADVDFNPMTGRLTVFGLNVEGPDSGTVSMERMIVNVDLLPLLKKRLQVSLFSLIGLSVDIRRSENGQVTIAGFPVPVGGESKETQQADGKASKPWGLAIEDLDIKDVSFHLITPDMDESVDLTHLALENFETWSPEKPGQFVLRVDLLGGAFDVEGSGQFFNEPASMSARVGFRDLPLERLKPYIGKGPVQSMSGALSGRAKVEVVLNRGPASPVTGSVDLNVFTQDASVVSSAGGMDLEISPGALSIDVSLDASLMTGEDPKKDVKFGVICNLEGSSARIADERSTLKASYDTLTARVEGAYSDTGSFDPRHLLAKGTLSAHDVVIGDGGSPAELVRLGSLDLEGISVAGSGEGSISSTRVSDIAILPRQPASTGPEEPAQAIALKSLSVTGLHLEGGSDLSIDGVQLDSLKGWILREKDGSLEATSVLDKLPGSGRADTTAGVRDKGSSPGENRDVTIKRISLTGDNSLAFRDLSVDPPFHFLIDSLSAEVRNLGTGKRAAASEVSAAAKMGKYSSASLEAKIKPPWDDPDVESHVKLKAIDLPSLTPYTKKYLGYILRSGHLDTDLDVRVEKGSLDSKADIVVNRIEMDPVKEENATKAEDRLGIPVNTALTLLTDKNDDIKLSLPVKGSLKDPEFKISDVLVTATGLALKKGVTAYYKGLGATLLTGGLIPPGTFSVLGKLFSGVTTMTFDPVIFSPLATQIDERGRTHLDLLAEKLREKPGVRLIMCGKVSREDMEALRKADFEAALNAALTGAQTATTSVTGSSEAAGSGGAAPAAPPGEAVGGLTGPATAPLPPGPPSIEEMPLTDDEKERLIELAKQRALSVKDHLAEVDGIDPERLFVCYSEVDTQKKDLPPRVDLSI